MAKQTNKWMVKRLYKCKSCGERSLYEQKCSEPFSTHCEYCGKEDLLLESGDCGLTTLVGLNEPKTVGSLGEKNYERAVKQGTVPDRLKNDKVVNLAKVKNKRHRMMKNPDNYIKTGKL